MGVEEKLNEAVKCCNLCETGTGLAMRKNIKKLVRDALDEVLENGHELGGMGEYGKGWNDRGVQVRMSIAEMKRRWSE